ncbi:hypothetical protein LEP1GSC034_2135 [Leptospira interrogans str. 2003000735]|uniref:Uncharacterized protein n=3 Tax=Leptospira interrogans TaxID=173 RepID=A0AAQ1SPA3_LEPIR|nr:hypothetical protein LEP1GSC027_1678 [Leptospira interrogans str. 2002000624]EKQ36087.1 hypothetical protein LEP1GSC025_0364 [Leptospira interrogans str. 2002000621]EKQ49907.1 hypothetical protein LEP1GSC026_1377 [Leptospira interrogans str. 2002000623]EMJ68188.1 hypothetical protein LEP1GSC034_2135 [Leptospira interrogans str. 2003000735]EMJ74616.1 hypothetical protein LEP1GSC033_0003 [Leptospira interrogans str. 2002000632]EMJ79227.1 hypothetical protein LEP1GSC032_1513 [Leptospira interr
MGILFYRLEIRSYLKNILEQLKSVFQTMVKYFIDDPSKNSHNSTRFF